MLCNDTSEQNSVGKHDHTYETEATNNVQSQCRQKQNNDENAYKMGFLTLLPTEVAVKIYSRSAKSKLHIT